MNRFLVFITHLSVDATVVIAVVVAVVVSVAAGVGAEAAVATLAGISGR